VIFGENGHDIVARDEIAVDRTNSEERSADHESSAKREKRIFMVVIG